MPEYIVELSPVRPIVDQNGLMSNELLTWAKTISNRSLIISAGSPESVIDAPIGSEYMDSSGTAGSIKYIKRDSDIGGDKTQGWILT
jgi:hypothetical protein